MMWPDYSCCDFCPYDAEYSTSFGTVCENCESIKAERRRNRMMIEYETDCDPEDSADE